MDKAGFDSKVSLFFPNYLVGRKTHYLWNSFIFPSLNADVGVGQGSVLSSILSALFISPIFHIFDKRAKNLKIPISFLWFVDNGLFISQEKSFDKTNTHLFCSYNIISSLLEQFSLIIKYRKAEVFHFSRSHGLLDPPSLNLSHIGGPILCPKNSWKYLRFIFDKKLLFCQHIKYYANKALSIVKYIKILGNSMCGLLPYQKCLLYKICVLSITFYSFPL